MSSRIFRWRSWRGISLRLPIKIDDLLGANVMEFFRMTVDRRAKELRLEPSQ